MRAPPRSDPPPPSAWLLRWFARYCERYVARHFHGVHLLGPAPCIEPQRPLVIYLNHASWWDPLLCLLLARRCFRRAHALRAHGCRDAAPLRLSEDASASSAWSKARAAPRPFSRATAAILARPGATLWLTPQGRFADPRERPPRFAAGLAHLARRFPRPTFLPLALEYPFWTERAPEALAHFGDPRGDLEQPSPTRKTPSPAPRSRAVWKTSRRSCAAPPAKAASTSSGAAAARAGAAKPSSASMAPPKQ